MTLRLGTLLLVASSAIAMSAQTPSAVQDTYSRSGVSALKDGGSVVYSFGSWQTGGSQGSVSLWPALFEEMLASGGNTLVSGVFADADGIELGWNGVEKVLTVKCDPDKFGRTNVLIADLNGATRGMVAVENSPAQITLSNHVAGTYVIAVTVDAKIVKTFKIILK